MLRQICPDINFNGIVNRRKNSKPRILFLSEFLTMDSSVLRDRMGIMTKLPSAKFDVYYASYTDPQQIVDNISKQVFSLFDNNYLYLTDDFDANRKLILQYNFDVIIYCELGMRMRPYYLAHSRLAPIQITTWGHSETSGINTIDYYISSRYFEHESAQNHYTEKLVVFNSLSTYYYPPSQILAGNHVFQTRKDLQLDTNVNLYGCIQSSFKISEAFEDIMCNILEKDRNGYIMLSQNRPFCESQKSRMYEKFGDKFNRLIFYPGLPITTYLNMVKLMDVMLDPFPFGGCNTSFEAFDFNVPVVTLPTKYINGRFTYGLYRKMGFIDMIATNNENYVKIAVKCATDKQWRQGVSDKIAQNKHLIFMEEDSVYEWSDFLLKKISEHKLD
jgi:predicted O-linked N-acetylglucosamine transferase (SPINDLY family)